MIFIFLSTASLKNGKTPAEMYYGVKPCVKRLHVFGCVAYRLISKQFRNKFDSKTEKCIFIGYSENGYRLYDPIGDKIKFARNVIFDESKTFECTSEVLFDEDEELDEAEENVSNLSQPEDVITSKTEELPRRSTRQTRLPTKFNDYEMNPRAMLAFVHQIPETYDEAINGPNTKKWQAAMEEEMQSILENKTWVLTPPDPGSPVIDCKWVYAIKNQGESNERYKARLVAKGFMDRTVRDVEETYAPVAKMTTIRTLLAVANEYDMDISHFDIVKTAFLHGDLQEKLFMRQPSGFEQGKNLVYMSTSKITLWFEGCS